MKRSFENPNMLETLNRLRKNKKPLWKRVREILASPTRKRISINVSRLSKLSKKHKDVVFVVPGKILGSGAIKNKFDVLSFSVSDSAVQKMKQAGCKHYDLKESVDQKGQISVKGNFMILR
ncbi:50S ribosomal protein L18e [Candidatus Micrarchaeota archaeon]|nr:50S ribosomal protein L18e [Candidatus Micrarchaeota archaeon]